MQKFEFSHTEIQRTWPIFRKYIEEVLFSKVTETEDREYLQRFKMPSSVNFNTLTDYNTQFLSLATNSGYELTDKGDDMMLRICYLDNMEVALKKDLFRDEMRFPGVSITARECVNPEDSSKAGGRFTLKDLIAMATKRVSTRDSHRILLKHRLREDTPDTDTPPPKRGKTNDRRMVVRTSDQSTKRGAINSISEVKALKTFDEDVRLEAWRKAGKPKPGDAKAPLGFFSDGSPRTCNRCNSMDHFLKDCPQFTKKLRAELNTIDR